MTAHIIMSVALLAGLAIAGAANDAGAAHMAYRVIERHYGPDIRVNDWQAEGAELVCAGGALQASTSTNGTVTRNDYPLPGGGDVRLRLTFSIERFGPESALTVHFNRQNRGPDGFRVRLDAASVSVTHNTREVHRSAVPLSPAQAEEHTVELVTLGEDYALSLDGVQLASGQMDPPFNENEGRLVLELSDAEVWVLACEESFIVADREFPPWRRTELLYEETFGHQALVDNWVCNGEQPIVTDDAFTFTHMSVNICRERFEGPIAVDCVVEPMPTEEYSAGVTDLICIWMMDKPEGDLFEYMQTLEDASLNHYLPLPFYWVDFGGTNNKTTRLRKNPYRQMVRQFNDRARLLQRDTTYRITMVQNADIIEFRVDGQCWIQRHDPHPLTTGHVGFRAFIADVKLSELKVWRIGQ